MDRIIENAQRQINIVKKIATDKNRKESHITLTKYHKLQDIFLYELNLEKECNDFCNIVNHQLSQNYKKLANQLKSFNDSNELPYNKVEDSEFDDNINNNDNETSIEDELKLFTDDIKNLRNSSAETGEVQVMMNNLPKYLNIANTEYINRTNNRIKRETELLKTQKIRALDFLYEMQEFCAELLEFDKYKEENKD